MPRQNNEKGVNVMKKNWIWLVVALVLSHVMCIFVTYEYVWMLCGIKYECFSAPAWVALLYAIPFLVGICICLAIYVWKTKKK